ncbi:MAG: ABC transporter permease [Propionicimonas sp.]
MSQAEAAMPRRIAQYAMQYAFLVGFFITFAYFAVAAPSFLSGSNMLNMIEGSMLLLFVALAMTVIVASGGIDLSVGIAFDFGAWFSIIMMMNFGVPWPLAILIALAVGTLVGLLNAFLIVKLRVTPFLATLGTYFIGRSVQQIGTDGGATVSYRRAPKEFLRIAQGDILGLPNEIWFGAIVLVIFFLVLQRSVHGRRLHAMGLQNSAAIVAGVPVPRYRALAYILTATTCAAAGILLSSGLRIYTPNAGFSYFMDAIAAVFIGASMHPRSRPNVPGTLIGVLFLGVVGNGLDLLGLDFNVKAALQGLILVVALALAYLVAKRSRRSLSA